MSRSHSLTKEQREELRKLSLCHGTQHWCLDYSVDALEQDDEAKLNAWRARLIKRLVEAFDIYTEQDIVELVGQWASYAGLSFDESLKLHFNLYAKSFGEETRKARRKEFQAQNFRRNARARA